jgi:hypothetical protein
MEKVLNAIFIEANNQFLKREVDNILNGISERNLCGRLSHYVELLLAKNKIKGYFADPEYNRKQNGAVKTILDDDAKIVTIQCDLIVHSRGTIVEQDNLIAVEMKKSNRPEEEKVDDKNRLRALTKDSYDGVWSADGIALPEHVCGYVLGFYMELNLKDRTCLIEKYRKGNKVEEWMQGF